MSSGELAQLPELRVPEFHDAAARGKDASGEEESREEAQDRPEDRCSWWCCVLVAEAP